MKDMLVAVTAVGLFGFAQAGEPSFYRQCKDLVASPDAAKDQTHNLIQACVNYYMYGWQRGWLPKQIESKAAEAGQPGQSGQGGDGGAGGSLPGLAGGEGGVGGGGGEYFPDTHYRIGSEGYYGYKYCEELIGPPHGPRDDYTYGLLEDCVAYYRYNWRHGWPSYAMGSPPPPEPAQPGEPGQPGQGGAGGAGGSLPGLSGGEGGDGGSLRSGSYRGSSRGRDGADGESYGTGEGGEGGSAGRGPGGGSGGGGGAGSTGGIGGAGGAGGDAR